MGSMIHLAVGRLEIDWGKNLGFVDHSALFQGEADVAQVPYYYAGDDENAEKGWRVITEFKEGLSKPLALVAQRLEMLGYTLEHCELEFLAVADLTGFDSESFTFTMLRDALRQVDVGALSADYGEGGEDFGKFFRREIAPRLGLGDEFESRAAEGMENVSAYTILRLLADNPKATSCDVTWAFNDLEVGGWATRQTFVRELEPENKFLIVTEGSSDAAILRHALKLLRPQIADFFHFVDMDKGYPFTGTGNLFNFVKGLVSIAIQNNIVVVYDNDAEGAFGHTRCQRLALPGNMRVIRLPDMEAFIDIAAVGPGGEHRADINGRAAAIECYLDVPEPRIRWSNYIEQVGAYQGALERKEIFSRAFLAQQQVEAGYNYQKLEALLDAIIAECVAIREAQREPEVRDL